MAYCTQSDIEKRIPEETLIELTDDDSADAVDTANVTRAIEDADDEIDSFLSLQFSLPLESTWGLIRRMSVDLAICNLYGRRPHLTIPETQKERCDSSRKLLEKIAAGKLGPGSDGPSPSSDAGIETTKTKNDRVFTTGRKSDGSTGTLDNY